MTIDSTVDCPWLERVSALMDGELPANENELVATHAQSCASCRVILQSGTGRMSDSAGEQVPRLLSQFPSRMTPWMRATLIVVGTLIIVGALPDFIKGNTTGDALHDLRHLSIWQVAVGMTGIIMGFTFRLSRLIAVIAITFLSLTVIATIYDLLTGHRGPWTDPTHVGEVIAVVVLLRIAWPQMRLRTIRSPNVADPATPTHKLTGH